MTTKKQYDNESYRQPRMLVGVKPRIYEIMQGVGRSMGIATNAAVSMALIEFLKRRDCWPEPSAEVLAFMKQIAEEDEAKEKKKQAKKDKKPKE